jgi:hypothetical protein
MADSPEDEDKAARDRLNTMEREERFVANLAAVASKREQKELVDVATMTDAEKIEHMKKKQHEEQKSKAMLAQAGGFTKKPAKTGRGRNLSRSGSVERMRGESGIFEPFRCDLTIDDGPLGVGVSRSKDEAYMLQFDYYTDKGNAKELSDGMLEAKMVLTHLNNEDQSGVTYDDVKLKLKDPSRPMTMTFQRSEENAKFSVAHIRGGGIEVADEEWVELDKAVMREAGAAPLRVRGNVQQQRWRGTKNIIGAGGLRKQVWKDVYFELSGSSIEVFKTEARATSHCKHELVDVNKVLTTEQYHAQGGSIEQLAAVGDDDAEPEEKPDEKNTETGFVVNFLTKDKEVLEIRVETAEIADAWMYGIRHNRNLAQRAAGVKSRRRRSASWG